MGPMIISSSTGCHIEGSLFWFDDPVPGDICFLSAMPRERVLPWGAKLMVSEDLGRILTISSKGYRRNNSVVCLYQHPFSIGSYEIEFLPAGAALGSASIHINSPGWSLLYAPHAMPLQKPLTALTVLKKADILVLRASSPDLSFQVPHRKEQLRSLAEYCLSFYAQHNFYPLIVCEALGCAQEINQYLGEQSIKVALSSQIYQFTKLYREAGVDLGSHWSHYHQKYFRKKAVIVSPQSLPRLKLSAFFRRSMIYVTGDLISYQRHKDQGDFERLYFLNYHSTIEDIEAAITATSPHRVVLTGPYIRHYKEQLGSRIPSLNLAASYPNRQPTLADLM